MLKYGRQLGDGPSRPASPGIRSATRRRQACCERSLAAIGQVMAHSRPRGPPFARVAFTGGSRGFGPGVATWGYVAWSRSGRCWPPPRTAPGSRSVTGR
jgi:hypothetical protein